jgi:hypothetical protein
MRRIIDMQLSTHHCRQIPCRAEITKPSLGRPQSGLCRWPVSTTTATVPHLAELVHAATSDQGLLELRKHPARKGSYLLGSFATDAADLACRFMSASVRERPTSGVAAK